MTDYNNNQPRKSNIIEYKNDFNNSVKKIIDNINKENRTNLTIENILSVNKNKDNFIVNMTIQNGKHIDLFKLDFNTNEQFTNITVNEFVNVNRLKKLEDEIVNDMLLEKYTPRDQSEIEINNKLNEERQTINAQLSEQGDMTLPVNIPLLKLPRYKLMFDEDLDKVTYPAGGSFGPEDITYSSNSIHPVLKEKRDVYVKEIPHLHFDENGELVLESDIELNEDGNMVVKDTNIRVYHYDDSRLKQINNRPTDPVLQEDEIFQQWLKDNDPSENGYWENRSKEIQNAYKRATQIYSKIEGIRDCVDLCYDKCEFNEETCELKPRIITDINHITKQAKDSEICAACFDDDGNMVLTDNNDVPYTYQVDCKVKPRGENSICYDANKEKYVEDLILKNNKQYMLHQDPNYLKNRSNADYLKINLDQNILSLTLGGECTDTKITENNIRDILLDFKLDPTTSLNNDKLTVIKNIMNNNNLSIELFTNLLSNYIKNEINKLAPTTVASPSRVKIDNIFLDNFIKYLNNYVEKTATTSVGMSSGGIKYNQNNSRFRYDIDKFNCGPMFAPVLLQSRVPVDDRQGLFTNCLRS